MNEFKKEINTLKINNDTLTEMVKLKKNDVHQEVTQKMSKVEDELKRYIAHQKAENSRINQQIYFVKSEKIILQSQLNSSYYNQ